MDKTENERLNTLKGCAEALDRIVNEAFTPPTTRHRRRGFGGSPCDITCQPCALEQGRKALAALKALGVEVDNG